VPAARRELKKHYRTVTELARKQVEFFPVKEGSANCERRATNRHEGNG
jgi:hypothetical protein